MRKLFVSIFLLCAAFAANAAGAVWSFSYVGTGFYSDHTGSGTFTTSSGKVFRPQEVLSVSGSFTTVLDMHNGLNPTPIFGVMRPGVTNHFTYDNIYGGTGPALFSGDGLLWQGRREASNGLFPTVYSYVRLYSVEDSPGTWNYYVDEWFPPYGGFPGLDYVFPVTLTVNLLSS